MKNLFPAYLELTKPRITTLVLITTALGYYLGGGGISSILHFTHLMIGVALICGGSATLNHYLEREYDINMERTKNRPIPSGVIKAHHALSFGIILTLVGLSVLYIKINILTAFLSLLTTFLYVLVYTPMKRVSWLNTTFGAIPGAIPPLGGWAAATGTLDFNAGMLFLILFIWQHPHFYAIAWMFKDDYKRGGFKMLPSIDSDGRRTFQQIIWFSVILIPISVIPTFTGLTGIIYFIGALISGVFLFFAGLKLTQTGEREDAVKLLRATVYYLPLLFLLIVLDAKQL
jgi:protoheme IX farnesyltransferase